MKRPDIIWLRAVLDVSSENTATYGLVLLDWVLHLERRINLLEQYVGQVLPPKRLDGSTNEALADLRKRALADGRSFDHETGMLK
jgi:hypothetical protein